MVSCNYYAEDEQGQRLRESHHICGIHTLDSNEQRLDYILHRVLGYETGWEVWTRLFDLDVIRQNQIRFCERCGNYSEDLGFVLEMCLCSTRILGLDFLGCHHMLRSGSAVRSSTHGAMLDAVNECARHFSERFFAQIREPELQARYPVIHYRMLRGEYAKIPTRSLPEALNAIREKTWYRQQVRGILRQKAYLRRCFGREEAGKMLVFSRFCLHRRVPLFRLESAIEKRNKEV